LPQKLRGFRVRDLEHAFGQKKAKRIIAWLTSTSAPNVVAFPIDQVRSPLVVSDRGTGKWSRAKVRKLRDI
jgi:hypothetical protein